MHNILLIGDSLTYLGSHKERGWVNYLKMWYKNKANIINKGLCLYTSKMIRDEFDEITCNTIGKFDLCTILLGTNDCYNPNLHITPGIYKENILFMIDNLLSKNPNCIIFLITPPSCKINECILEYVDQIYDIVSEIQIQKQKQKQKQKQLIILIDLYKGNNNIDCTDLDQDGIHLNTSGNWKIYCKIKEAIEKQISFFTPNNL